MGRYLLHNVVGQMTALYDEFAKAHVVALDVPPIAEARYEHRLLDVVTRIRQAGPHVAVVLRPNMRRNSDKALWV